MRAADRDIGIAVGKIDDRIGDEYPHGKPGLGDLKTAQPPRQPVGGEGSGR
jgi:hypothetical protein